MPVRRPISLFAILSALLLGCQPAAARTSESLKQALAVEKIAGGVWSIVDERGVRTGAVGTSHRPSGRPMRHDSNVHVGSITKTLIALGVLRLVSEGRLSLDAPLAPLLPEIRFENRWAASHPIRVRHLLDHTAGLEDARLWQLFSSRISPDVHLAEVVTRSPDMLQARTPPGEVFSYSNFGYAIAALLIERVTGERYERWLAANLLRPLGMTDSSFGFVSQAGPAADPRLGWGHLGAEKGVITDGIDLARLHAPIARAVAVRPSPAPSAPSAPAVPPTADPWTGTYVPLVSRFAIERYADRLIEGATLQRMGTALTLVRSGHPSLVLNAADGGLLRATGRSVASHALLRNAGGEFIVTDGLRSFRQVPAWQVSALWANLLLGLAGLAYLLLVLPWIARRCGRTLAQPATVAILAFVPVAALIATTPFQRWGDLTVASGLLAAATFVLPVAAAAQLFEEIRWRDRWWRANAIAAILLLQWCAVLAAFGLWPIMLWR